MHPTQSTRYNQKVELTVDALTANLKAMIGLLERSGLNSHVPFYRRALLSLSLSCADNKLPCALCSPTDQKTAAVQ